MVVYSKFNVEITVFPAQPRKKSKSKKRKVQDSHDPEGTCILRLFINWPLPSCHLSSCFLRDDSLIPREESLALQYKNLVSRDEHLVL